MVVYRNERSLAEDSNPMVYTFLRYVVLLFITLHYTMLCCLGYVTWHNVTLCDITLQIHVCPTRVLKAPRAPRSTTVTTTSVTVPRTAMAKTVIATGQVRLFVHVSVCPSVSVFVYLPMYLSVLSICLSLWIPVCLSCLYMSVHLSACLSDIWLSCLSVIYLSVSLSCLSFCLFKCLSVFMSIYPPIYMFCLFVCLPVCPSVSLSVGLISP